MSFCLLIFLGSYIPNSSLQDGREKQAVPAVRLNLIRLLADLSVSVNKWEVVDMVLPLFIESLEEGDAAVPSLLRLQVQNSFSLTCICFLSSLALFHFLFEMFG